MISSSSYLLINFAKSDKVEVLIYHYSQLVENAIIVRSLLFNELMTKSKEFFWGKKD